MSESKFSFEQDYDRQQLQILDVLKVGKLPTVLMVFTAASLFFTIASLLFITFVPWVQTISGAGQIVALNPAEREQAISALVPGRIAEWYVREGSRVEEGQTIARLVDNDPRLMDRLQTQLDLARDRLASANSALSTAKLDAERKMTLFSDGLVSRLEMEQAQISLAEYEVRAQGAADELNRAEIALSREGSQLVVAPRAGVITRVSAGGTATFVKAVTCLPALSPITSKVRSRYMWMVVTPALCLLGVRCGFNLKGGLLFSLVDGHRLPSVHLRALSPLSIRWQVQTANSGLLCARALMLLHGLQTVSSALAPMRVAGFCWTKFLLDTNYGASSTTSRLNSLSNLFWKQSNE